MSMRFCPSCDQEVEASGGYCLLGHKLALTPPSAPLEVLREEVDRAFDEAPPWVDAVVSDVAASSSASVTAPAVSVAASDAGTASARGSVAAPPRPRRVGPPPPPPPRRTASPATDRVETGSVPTEHQLMARKADVWKVLEDDVDLVGDPIGSFAPPPNMDWGPRESKLRRKPTRTLARFKRNKAEDSDSSDS